MTSTAMVMLGAAVFAGSLEAGSPPSRQTPYIVPKDKQGMVEVGPCQMPPCVGGKTCTPNARDYGYYEGTWRKWPTQQRYDQKFPQAVGATPMNQPQNQSLIAAPAPVVTAPQLNDTPIITVPEESEPTPIMGNFEAPNVVVPNAPAVTAPELVIPATENEKSAAPEVIQEEISVPAPQAPKAPVDPLLDYSSNQVPGISTSPAITSAVSAQKDAPVLEALPEPEETAPQLEVLPPLDDTADDAADDDTETELTAPTAEDDTETELTAPTADSAPLLETEPESDADDSSLSFPMSQTPPVERSIIVPKEDIVENGSAPNGNFAAVKPLNPYDHAIQVSHTEEAAPTEEAVTPAAAAETSVNPFTSAAANPFDSSNVPADLESTSSEESVETETSEETVQDILEDSANPNPFNAAKTEDSLTGLEGFCPVSLIENEEWVEGNEQWSVMHDGITYHLSSAAQVQKFLANPEAYTPVMNGADPVLWAETGEKTQGNADNCIVFEGKLFMFTSEENLNKFFENTSAYVK